MSTETMPFGKFAVQPITEVETSYLEWALRKVDWTRWPDTQRLIEQELDARTRPDLKGKRRKVVVFEERHKSSIGEQAIYDHWFLCTLNCGHTAAAVSIKHGQCPATVTCTRC